MKTVLFLDDEPKILDLAREALTPITGEWDVLVATTIEMAQGLTVQRQIDVVVTDIHLSGIGGIQFLTEVKARFPQMVRIACSSCAHRDMVIRGLAVAHQFLSKPFHPTALRSMLIRAAALQARLASRSMRELVAGITTLPSLPTIYEDLVSAMRSPSATAETASRIITKDMAMVSKLLQIVNSAYYGLRRTISSPAQAIALLGVETVKSLVLSVKIFAELGDGQALPLSLDALWKHSLDTAVSARKLALKEERGQIGIEGAFIAGLLHDVGLLVLISKFPDQYQEVLQLVSCDDLSIVQAEKTVFQASHADVGGYLLGVWGLSDALVEAVVFHHEPKECASDGFSPLAAVHMANVVEEERDASLTGNTKSILDGDYLRACGLADRVPAWRKICLQHYEIKAGGAA
jgi:HD-like signal output (HDOD) protein